MPGRISNSIGSIAVVAALLVSGLGVDLRTHTARANDCLAAPNASAPQGKHWYYRIHRPNSRKCWYLHATVALLHQAAKRAELHKVSTAAGAPMSASLAESAPHLPDTTTLSVKLQPTLVVSAPAEEVVSAAAEEPARPNAQQEGDRPFIPLESGSVSARADVGPETSDSPGNDNERSRPTTTPNVADALLVLLLIVSGLASAGFLISVVIKAVASRRILPETARVDYQFHQERPDTRAQGVWADDRSGLRFADARSRENFIDPQHGIEGPSPAPTLRSTKQTQNDVIATSVKPPRRDAEGIERALDAIRQGRQRQMA